jgi:hypothetical protein
MRSLASSSALVALPDGSSYAIKRLLCYANHKQEKGHGFLSVGLTLTRFRAAVAVQRDRVGL